MTVTDEGYCLAADAKLINKLIVMTAKKEGTAKIQDLKNTNPKKISESQSMIKRRVKMELEEEEEICSEDNSSSNEEQENVEEKEESPMVEESEREENEEK